MSSLAHYLPDLKNLSLEGNKLQGWKEMDYISGKRGRLTKLRELILTGNPCTVVPVDEEKWKEYKRCASC